MSLHPQAQAVADFYAAMRATPFEELSPNDARAVYNAGQIPSEEVVFEIRDIDAGGIPCRFYRPSSDTDLGLLVFFHGGGWVIGDLDSHDGVCRSLANKSGHAVLSVDYRLAPEHKFPAAYDDCVGALRWAHDHAASLGVDKTRIAVGGDSAGGNLAAAVALAEVVPLRFQLLIYPCVDMTVKSPSIDENATAPILTKSVMAWFVDNYMRDSADYKNIKASPIVAEDSLLKRMPPALVITAQFDPLRDEGEAYGKRLVENGVNCTITRYNGAFHGFFNMITLLDDAQSAHAQASTLLKKYLD
ncbi:MAG: alpha/beta hydrolase [Ilumatobacteraceae bacterium]